MGQKIHPYGLRLGIVTDWKSRWYSEKDYAAQVNEDSKIRRYLYGELTRGALSRIDIERIGDKKVQIDVHTARPGVVIGRSGSEADRLRRGLEDLTNRLVKFNVIEVQNPELDAKLLSRSVADQLEGRVSFRRAMKRAVQAALKAGAEGVRVQASGRLGGADMGRREWYLEGRVPLHTLRADVDFGQSTASTTVGAIGVKVWVYKGDVIPSLQASRDKIAAEARLAAGGPSERRRSVKSRAEAPDGRRGSRLIEAGGGKRLVEAGGGKRKEGGKRLIEAGGGRRPTKSEALAQFEEAREEVEEVKPGAAAEGAAKPGAAGEGAAKPGAAGEGAAKPGAAGEGAAKPPVTSSPGPPEDAAAPDAGASAAIDEAVDADEPEPIAAIPDAAPAEPAPATEPAGEDAVPEAETAPEVPPEAETSEEPASEAVVAAGDEEPKTGDSEPESSDPDAGGDG
jgi:small subunit ribosomal protein S3